MAERNVCVISVDMGTSSVRACLINHDLHILHQSQIELGMETDHSGKAIQNAEEIIQKTLRCIGAVQTWAQERGITPAGISFSNAVSSLVPLDKQFEPIGPVFTYADTRSHLQADRLRSEEKSGIFQYTACPLHASYWLPKLLWLRDERPELFNSHYFCTIKDVLLYRLSGQFITDTSNAVATGLCDVRIKDWDDDLLKLAGIQRGQLPVVMPTSSVIALGGRDPGLAETPIVLGATDGVLSSLGAGAVAPGQVTTMIGSSGACRIASDSPLTTGSGQVIWSYPLDDGIWIRGGAMNNGGLVMQWAAHTFYNERAMEGTEPLDRLLEYASTINPGSDGLVFLPYLYGERAPIWNEQARGVFFGVGASHQRAHFSRAVLEGILCALYSIFEIISSDHTGSLEIRASGGYVRSDMMLQIQADMFRQPVKVPSNLEGSSIGAAALAMKALGVFENYNQAVQLMPAKKTFFPDPAYGDVYVDLYRRFKQIYKQTKPLMTVGGLDDG